MCQFVSPEREAHGDGSTGWDLSKALQRILLFCWICMSYLNVADECNTDIRERNKKN